MTITGKVICGATAARCRCVLTPGHDGPHECEPELCGGSWTGSQEDGTFKTVSLPHLRLP